MMAVGSIPAPAGEPRGYTSGGSPAWVYPRACGGTLLLPVIGPTLQGLSPRLRGNPPRDTMMASNSRSIPAPAEEPQMTHTLDLYNAVYPRACGGTKHKLGVVLGPMGLSPRLRGNPVVWTPENLFYGSIPAPAGEPTPGFGRCLDAGVYPRACGGTQRRLHPRGTGDGLSPRLRGNLGYRE